MSDAQKNLITPPKEDEVLVTFPDTFDGFVAAWVVRNMAREKNVALEMCNAPSPDIDLTGRNWILIGESMNATEIGSTPKSGISIQRHSDDANAVDPLPFKDWKRTFPYGIATMVKSGVWARVSGTSLCKAAWEFFNPEKKLPRLLYYMNNSVTENFVGDTPDVIACVASYFERHLKSFATLDKLVEACDDPKRLAYVIAGGQAIRRYIETNGL